MLADGSNYRVVKPTPWNGTIVLDLDFANNLSAPPSAIERWMTANGYAIGGISREPVAYRFRQAVDDLLEVRRLFTAKWNAMPTRTLTLGNSRGGFVSRVAMERYPDIFKGAVLSAGGGAGEVGTFNAKLDGLWTLKVLTGAPLTLVGYASPADALAENDRLTALVKELRSTPAGRARLALAAAFEQFPRWTGGDAPPAAHDLRGAARSDRRPVPLRQSGAGAPGRRGGGRRQLLVEPRRGLRGAARPVRDGGPGRGDLREIGREPRRRICGSWRRRRGFRPTPRQWPPPRR